MSSGLRGVRDPTPCETDVFVQLTQGGIQIHICEKPRLSKSAMPTYAANVYLKCGIHSKRELIDMVAEKIGIRAEVARF